MAADNRPGDLRVPWQLIMDLGATALAAEARAVRFEGGGWLGVHRRAARMAAMTSHDDQTQGREAWLLRWRSQCFLLQLSEADRQVQALLSRLPRCGLRLDERAGWQGRVAVACRTGGNVLAWRHLRRRLDRWPVATLPGHRLHRALARLQRVAAGSAPRVTIAYLRTLCGGWCPSRCSRGQAPCLFGCGGRPDGVQHFAHCSVVRRLLTAGAGLTPPRAGRELDLFLGFDWPDAESIAWSRALYALYRIHNSLRHGRVTSEQLDGAFRGALWEATSRTE